MPGTRIRARSGYFLMIQGMAVGRPRMMLGKVSRKGGSSWPRDDGRTSWRLGKKKLVFTRV